MWDPACTGGATPPWTLRRIFEMGSSLEQLPQGWLRPHLYRNNFSQRPSSPTTLLETLICKGYWTWNPTGCGQKALNAAAPVYLRVVFVGRCAVWGYADILEMEWHGYDLRMNLVGFWPCFQIQSVTGWFFQERLWVKDPGFAGFQKNSDYSY